jgi:hypothetical protein
VLMPLVGLDGFTFRYAITRDTACSAPFTAVASLVMQTVLHYLNIFSKGTISIINNVALIIMPG